MATINRTGGYQFVFLRSVRGKKVISQVGLVVIQFQEYSFKLITTYAELYEAGRQLYLISVFIRLK